MSTRARIAIKRADGSYDSIYCHNDGYPSYTGDCLKTYYNNTKAAEEIIKLGDLSYIDEKLYPTGKGHSFDTPEEGVTVAYGRDRGESDIESIHSKNIEDFASLCDNCWAEYAYIWNGNEWEVYETSELLSSLNESNQSLTRAIFSKLNEDDTKDDWKAIYEAKRKAQKDFADSVDLETLYKRREQWCLHRSIFW